MLTLERINEIFQSEANDDPEVHERFARAIEKEVRKDERERIAKFANETANIIGISSQANVLANFAKAIRAMKVKA